MDDYRVSGVSGGGLCDYVYRDWGMVMAGFDRDYLVAVGAYGRDATETDWRAGKDFQIKSGPYFSIRDCETIKRDGVSQIIFYNRQGYLAFIEDL